MTYSLSLRPRALAEIEAASDRYDRVEHGDSFLVEVERVLAPPHVGHVCAMNR